MKNEEFTIKVKAWLKDQGRSSQWLADRCEVKLSAVYSWFSTRGFPDDQKERVTSMMGLKPKEETSMIRVPLTDEVLKIAHAASFIVSSDLQDFCAKAIRHRGEEIIKMNMEAKAKQIDPAEEAELERKEHGGEASTRTA